MYMISFLQMFLMLLLRIEMKDIRKINPILRNLEIIKKICNLEEITRINLIWKNNFPKMKDRNNTFKNMIFIRIIVILFKWKWNLLWNNSQEISIVGIIKIKNILIDLIRIKETKIVINKGLWGYNSSFII